MDKNDTAINKEERRNLHERREGDILGKKRRSQVGPTLMDLKNQCKITDTQIVRFAFYFRQGHFLFPPWEIYRHLHIKRAR